VGAAPSCLDAVAGSDGPRAISQFNNRFGLHRAVWVLLTRPSAAGAAYHASSRRRDRRM
jgi:hypothetical protein